jgi:hypothetical protein
VRRIVEGLCASRCKKRGGTKGGDGKATSRRQATSKAAVHRKQYKGHSITAAVAPTTSKGK